MKAYKRMTVVAGLLALAWWLLSGEYKEIEMTDKERKEWLKQTTALIEALENYTSATNGVDEQLNPVDDGEIARNALMVFKQPEVMTDVY